MVRPSHLAQRAYWRDIRKIRSCFNGYRFHIHFCHPAYGYRRR